MKSVEAKRKRNIPCPEPYNHQIHSTFDNNQMKNFLLINVCEVCSCKKQHSPLFGWGSKERKMWKKRIIIEMYCSLCICALCSDDGSITMIFYNGVFLSSLSLSAFSSLDISHSFRLCLRFFFSLLYSFSTIFPLHFTSTIIVITTFIHIVRFEMKTDIDK